MRRASFFFFIVSNSIRTSVNLVSSALTLAAMFAFSVRISVSIAITLLMPEGSSASRTGGPSGVLGLLSGLARLVQIVYPYCASANTVRVRIICYASSRLKLAGGGRTEHQFPK